MTTVPRSSSSTSPNLLFIMTDQQRYDALGCMQERLPWYADTTRLRTPRLDQLAREGAWFTRAFSPCAVCAPCRTMLRTGCSLERTGAQSNDLVRADVYRRMPMFQQRIEALETFDQILVEDRGYTAEHYGKWHQPLRFLRTRDGQQSLYQYNHYDWRSDTPGHTERDHYKGDLAAFADQLRHTCQPGEQRSTYSDYPYQPSQLDARYGLPSDTPLVSQQRGGLVAHQRTAQPDVIGRDSVPAEYTPTALTAQAGLQALDRLAAADQPFALTISFHCPHAPMVATPAYYDYYWQHRDRLFVAPSHDDSMANSAYRDINHRLVIPGQADPELIREWTVPYYAMVEEIDHHVGRVLDRLAAHGLDDNTLVIFLSDHGEMLGAHGMREKNIFLEESARVPLMMRLPGAIRSGVEVAQPVSLIDVFASLLDYCGASAYDRGDGRSLRRFIEQTTWNQHDDDEAIVTEWDFRDPTDDGCGLKRAFGGETNFLVVKDQWKLMMTKNSQSSRLDMLYNVADDPFELDNLLCPAGDSLPQGRDQRGLGATAIDEAVIGKAEHLRALLLEWLLRMDGGAGHYTDPQLNAGEGHGDYHEIRQRTPWPRLPCWVSHQQVAFGPAVAVGVEAVDAAAVAETCYRRTEYVYLGCQAHGQLVIEHMALDGPDAASFSITALHTGWNRPQAEAVAATDIEADCIPSGSSSAQVRDVAPVTPLDASQCHQPIVLGEGEYLRLALTFASPFPHAGTGPCQAQLRIRHSGDQSIVIPLSVGR